MTPEQYQRARRKLARYGEAFDPNVNQKLPQALVKTKAGKVAKRQPPYDKRPKTYYQAQCSFRGIKNSGSAEDLQQALLSRDINKDLAIHHEMVQLRREADDYEKQEKARLYEKWWNDDTTAFERKLLDRPVRALEEELAKPDSFLRRGCRVYNRYGFDIEQDAARLSLGCEEVVGPRLPPGSTLSEQSCQIIGEATAVRQQAILSRQQFAQSALEQWNTWKMKKAAHEDAQQAARHLFLLEASEMQDWDLTGKWSVHCDELAMYSSHRPEKLTMEIFKDDYRLDNVCADEPLSDEEEEYDIHLYPYGNPRSQSTGFAQAEPVPESPADLQRPRFCAKFQFGPVEGIMRMYPRSSTQGLSSWTSIKEQPSFQYRWRGRETGESQIQLGVDQSVQHMMFSGSGTRVEGHFNCPFIGHPVYFRGGKITHGRGQRFSSAYEWSHLNERAWDRECHSRWR